MLQLLSDKWSAIIQALCLLWFVQKADMERKTHAWSTLSGHTFVLCMFKTTFSPQKILLNLRHRLLQADFSNLCFPNEWSKVLRRKKKNESLGLASPPRMAKRKRTRGVFLIVCLPILDFNSGRRKTIV